MNLQPHRSCRFVVGERVHLLDVFNKPYKQGEVTRCEWSDDGSDIGWWVSIQCEDSTRYISHESDIRKMDPDDAVTKLGELADD
jgi:hypothetical protein